MRLEQNLEICEIEDNLVGEIYTSGLEMYAMSGMGLPKFGAFKPLGIGGPKPLRCASDPMGSGFGLLKDKNEKTYGIGREISYIETIQEIIEKQRRQREEEEAMRSLNLMERFRQPHEHDKHGYHINYEELIPGLKDPLLSNIHIPLGKKKK